MKTEFDNYRRSAVFGVWNRRSNKDIELVFFEPHCSEEKLSGMRRIDNLETFKATTDLIITNKISAELMNVSDKVITRYVFKVD